MRINGRRLCNNLKVLGQIGYVSGLGTTRMAYSDIFNQGRDYVKSQMEEAGLETFIDSVGNLTGVRKGRVGKKISIGSHIDTVPNGGMYGL